MSRLAHGLLTHFLLWHSCTGADDIQCPDGWHKLDGRCYWLSTKEHTFESCQHQVCGPKGATLACISPTVQTWFSWRYSGARQKDLLAVWIGLFRAGAQPDHATAHDKKLGWSWSNGCTSEYRHWVPGEPDDYCGGEDCAALTGARGGWIDASCRLRLPCLCEYPGKVSETYNLSVAKLRDDTCYADCGDLTKWCSAWPFLRLYDVNDDVCHWEEADGQKRGRGVSECAERVKARADCGNYFSYSVGRCRCNPPTGAHQNCTARENDANSDVFRMDEEGTRLVYSRQRCVYNTIVDAEYFNALRPASTPREFFRIWSRAAFIWLAFGLPCGVVMLVVTCRLCACGTCCRRGDDDGAWPHSDKNTGEASYGRLLDQDDTDSDLVVSRWIFRGAVGAIAYGVGLLALGATLAIHMSGKATGFVAELFEAFCMACSMAMVTRAACMVHRRLAPWARDVVGPWIVVLIVAKFGMACASLATVLVFSTLADRDYSNICFAEYAFRWAMLLTLPFQCLGGVALNQIMARAERYAGSRARIGGWVSALIVGNFCTGSSVWWAGYLDCVHEAYIGVAIFFVAAAFGQLVAGASLLVANYKVKMYFTHDAQSQQSQQWPAGGPAPAAPIGRPQQDFDS